MATSKSRMEGMFWHVDYKWIVLSNTTLGVLMATIDGSIVIISLPAIFNGLGVNPLLPSNAGLLIWMLLGYLLVTSVLLVTFGRLSDMLGRVKMYNLGFLIFAVASTLIYISSLLVSGPNGVLSLILLRVVQGVGSAFLFANNAAILTDAFKHDELGKAMGINLVAGVGGSIIGLVVGGILAAIDWHLVFLVSVPIGILGAVWSYLALHEVAKIREHQHLDIPGSITLGAGLTAILVGLTLSLLPYGGRPLGWYSPTVLLSLAAGIALIVSFIFIEHRSKDPLFHLKLFRIRAFSAGNVSQFLAGISRGGLQFMLIIWLQGIWLPMHGVSFINTPFWAAIYMLPLVLGFLALGPLSGYLSDRYGPRALTTGGMLLNALGFVILANFPANFSYIPFAVVIFIMGAGSGMFSAPNTAAIMNSVPPEYRGVASGMRATFLNSSNLFSIGIFFTLLIAGLSISLPHALLSGLVASNVPYGIALNISRIPPVSAVFAALLGYNPIKSVIPSSVFATIPKATADKIASDSFFPRVISPAFIAGMKLVMYAGAAMSIFAAAISSLRGRGRYVHVNF